MLIGKEEIKDIILWWLDNDKKKNSLWTVWYLNVRNFQLKAEMFFMKDNSDNIEKIYQYLYVTFFVSFLQKNKSKIFNIKDFDEDYSYYDEMYIKYTIKALLKNNEGKNFFTYLNRWTNKFLMEYFQKRKKQKENEQYVDEQMLWIKMYDSDRHVSQDEDIININIIFVFKKIRDDLSLSNEKDKKALVLKLDSIIKKIENKETLNYIEIKKVFNKLPKELAEKLKSLIL